MFTLDNDKYHRLLREHKMTLIDLAARTGIDHKMLSKIKTNRRKVSQEEILQIARGLSCRVEAITEQPISIHSYPDRTWHEIATVYFSQKYHRQDFYSHSTYLLPCVYDYCEPLIKHTDAFDPKAKLLVDPEVLAIDGDICIFSYKKQIFMREYVESDGDAYIRIHNDKYLEKSSQMKLQKLPGQYKLLGIVMQLLRDEKVKHYLF